MTLTPVFRMIEDIAQYSGRKDKEKLIERYSQDQDFRNVVTSGMSLTGVIILCSVMSLFVGLNYKLYITYKKEKIN